MSLDHGVSQVADHLSHVGVPGELTLLPSSLWSACPRSRRVWPAWGQELTNLNSWSTTSRLSRESLICHNRTKSTLCIRQTFCAHSGGDDFTNSLLVIFWLHSIAKRSQTTPHAPARQRSVLDPAQDDAMRCQKAYIVSLNAGVTPTYIWGLSS